jgi:phosphopantetheine--protein transferase-like protein
LVLGVGIDVVEVREFRIWLDTWWQDGAGTEAEGASGAFLQGELAYARTQVRSWESLAARLAAKRAVARAIGAADDVALREVEIVRGDSGELDVRLHGETRRLAEGKGAIGVRISMSHTRSTALAFAVLVG